MFCVATKFGWVLVTKLIFLSKVTVLVFDIGFLMPGVVAAIFRRYDVAIATACGRTSLQQDLSEDEAAEQKTRVIH